MNNNCITTYTGRHIDPLHPDPDKGYDNGQNHALIDFIYNSTGIG